MSYYDEEFYCEPNEFEEQIEEFKESLLKSVKDEYLAEMERLRKENAELQEFKKQKRNFEREIASLKHQSETDKEEAYRQAKRARLSELMGGFEVEMWTPEYYCVESRKCEQCDENRKIHFKTPLGRDVTETCTCYEKITVYHPAKNILRKISTRQDWGTIKNTWLYYSLKNDGDYDSAEYRTDNAAQNLYIPGVTAFEDVEKSYYRRFYFENFDDCYQFCVWKMEKEAGILPKAIETTETA
ncbi:hypothetical protein [Paenibacillus tyrfis]|uniref:hypothetical protein n=1 Tax=Paenibacillus tyrfis TaxID=1501230 RepID=UPI0020A233A7|nr:hypothetical protein [Paenibacillus tyrfis]MCP1306426.1 hypothetical protein [Paenibacillus tyrfis]